MNSAVKENDGETLASKLNDQTEAGLVAGLHEFWLMGKCYSNRFNAYFPQAYRECTRRRGDSSGNSTLNPKLLHGLCRQNSRD